MRTPILRIPAPNQPRAALQPPYPHATFTELKEIIEEYIYFFNYERIQLKTRQTPYQVRCLSS